MHIWDFITLVITINTKIYNIVGFFVVHNNSTYAHWELCFVCVEHMPLDSESSVCMVYLVNIWILPMNWANDNDSDDRRSHIFKDL